MTPFEIISVILATILLLGSILGIYIKTEVAISKIQLEVTQLRRDLMAKEIAICAIEKNYRDDICAIEKNYRDDAKENRDDHKDIINKIDKLVEAILK